MASILNGERFVTENLELFGFYKGNILLQVVKELLDNSYDACGGKEIKDAFIAITICVEVNFVIINVADNGRGINDPRLCFSCFQSEVHQETRIGKYGMGLTVSSFYAFNASQAPILLASRCRGTDNVLRYEIQFCGSSPIVNELPNGEDGDDFPVEFGTVIQLQIPLTDVDLENEIFAVYEYVARLQYGASYALTIEIIQIRGSEKRETRISNPRIMLCNSDEEVVASSMEWLSQALPQFQFLNFEMANIGGIERYNMEIHSIACISQLETTPNQYIIDCFDVIIPLKLWTYVNGKPLDATVDCAVTEQLRSLQKLSSHIRIGEGRQIDEILSLRSRKIKEFWNAKLDDLTQRSCVLIVIKINTENIAFQDLRKKAVVRLDDQISLSIRQGVRKTLLSLISSSFLNILFVDAKNTKDMYMEHIGASSLSRSISKWLSVTEDEESRQQWLQQLGATSTEEAQENLKNILLKK